MLLDLTEYYELEKDGEKEREKKRENNGIKIKEPISKTGNHA